MQKIHAKLNDFSSINNNYNPNNTPGTSNTPTSPQGAGAVQPQSMPQMPGPKGIDDMVDNMNKQAYKFDKALFRDDEIEQTINILNQRRKSNVLLIGDPGVGKTQIVEQIARDLANPGTLAHERLEGYILYELPLENLVSGNSAVGEIEQAVQSVVQYMSDDDNLTILFIDEFHRLMSNDPTYDKIRQILKPALSRGDMKLIGATTTTESRKILDDPAFKRRFSRVSIPELDRDQTATIIEKVKIAYEEHHGIKLPKELVPRLINLADEYKLANARRPDNVLTLLDRSLTDAKTEFIKAKQEAEKNNLTPPVTFKLNEKHLKKSAQNLVNLRKTTSKKGLYEDVLNAFNERLVGQDSAKKQIADVIRRKELNIFKSKRPESFLFAGSTGVGKTEIAKILSETLYGPQTIIRLNMTEYTNSSSLNRIKGSPDGFVGSNSDRERPFDKMENNPHQIVLLDEFEKAHQDVQQFFMQALDEGYVETERGVTIDFSKAIVIATTNAGVEELTQNNVGFGKQKRTRTDITKALSKSFKPELLNRFKHVIYFEAMSEKDYRAVLAIKYNKFAKEVNENDPDIVLNPQSIDLDHADDYKFIHELQKRKYDPALGARSAEDAMKTSIENALIRVHNSGQKRINLK